ncbi:MAG: hypothetical protein DRP89_02580 [Candidatus Neomarinimicrobiota bacterium]|nr:MAG: hypothetical protein DRP89_02580 [Candidatus Neomarinimicrobiota bacterium]
MKTLDITEAVLPLVKAFDKLGVSYFIAGSVASSFYGVPRATIDVDMVSDLKPQHVHSLVEMLGAAYYIDEEMILKAIQEQSSFNLIHLNTMLKVDIFIIKGTPYNLKALQRRRKDTFDEEKESIEFYIGSPEDIILSKLEWFRSGEYVSMQQWRDVLGILKVQRDLLDLEYLRHWASTLKLSSLLEKAFRDAEI